MSKIVGRKPTYLLLDTPRNCDDEGGKKIKREKNIYIHISTLYRDNGYISYETLFKRRYRIIRVSFKREKERVLLSFIARRLINHKIYLSSTWMERNSFSIIRSLSTVQKLHAVYIYHVNIYMHTNIRNCLESRDISRLMHNSSIERRLYIVDI